LTSSTKFHVVNLLSSLCLHQAVLDYVPRVSQSVTIQGV
jgi:hypothetical protein